MSDTTYTDMFDLSTSRMAVATVARKEGSSQPLSVSSIISVTLGVLVILNNLLPIVAMLRCRWLRSPSNYLVLSLSITDLLMGAAILILEAFLNYSDNLEAWRWSVVYFYPLVHICIAVTGVTMLLMATDRLLAVQRPLQYKQIWTIGTVRIALLVMWLFFAVYFFTINLYFGLNANPLRIKAGRVVSTFIPFKFILVPLVQVALATAIALAFYAVVVCGLFRRWRLKQNRNDKAEAATLRATKLMLGLFVILIVTWMPSVLFFVAVDMRQPQRLAIRVTRTVFEKLFLSSFMANPLMYPWMSQDFRRAYRLLLRGHQVSTNAQSNGASEGSNSNTPTRY